MIYSSYAVYICFDVALKHLVFAYKTFDKDYLDFNYFLIILLSFTICKTYYVSEQKNKIKNAYSLFLQELNTRIK
jgi:hypothetical protein